MNKHLPSLLCGLLLFILPESFAQQPTEEWSKRYNSVGNENIGSVAMAMDAAGNSYITSTSRHSFSYLDVPMSSITILKVSPAGKILWEKSYRADQTTQATAIAVDDKDGVYITGFIGNEEGEKDIITIRYDKVTGEENWVQRYDGPAGGSDESRDIATDNKGGVYITGLSSNFPGGIVISDFITIRYAADTGMQTWVMRYDGSDNSYDGANAIAVDGLGGVFVTGYSYRQGATIYDFTSDFATVRYEAATGKQTWVQRYNGPDNGYDGANAIAVDDQGGVYVAGSSSGGNTNDDFATIRYDAATGVQDWVKRYNGPTSGNDEVTDIAIDGLGGVFVTGFSASTETGSDYATVRYEAATGDQSWVSRYNGPANGYDGANAIAVDDQGGVYVTGISTGTETGYDYATIRYDAATGKQDWVQRYNGPANSFDSASAIAIDNSGNIYVAGVSIGKEQSSNIALVSYMSATGQERWVNEHEVEGNLSDNAIAIAVDTEGNSYVTGTSSYEEDGDPFSNRSSIVTIKYSPSGEELWVKTYNQDKSSRANAIAVDNSGGVYVTGYTPTLLGEDVLSDYVTIRFDAATGKQDWVQHYDGPANGYDGASAITVDNKGGVFVTGFSASTETGSDYATVRYDASTGKQSWVQRYNGPITKSYDVATAIAVDNSGGLYVTGYSNSAYATVRYETSTGKETWVQRYIGEGQSDYARAIAVDNAGGVYITGTSYRKGLGAATDIATIRYNALTGKESWISLFSGEEDGYSYTGREIAVDNQGEVYVTGYRYGGNNTDFTTLRYTAATGKQQWASYYDSGKGYSDLAVAIAADQTGSVYVTGVSFGFDSGSNIEFVSVFSTVKYLAANGKQVWEIQTKGPTDNAVAMALDKDNNIIVTGYSYSTATGEDFLTVKYSQGLECPVLSDAAIRGKSTAAVGTSGSIYSMAAPGANNFDWTLTDGNGNSYTKFTGQGTNSITVKWPSSPQVYKVSVSYSASGGCPANTVTKFVHVFDPDAGFVTGGGWSDFPANATLELMQKAGKAQWGFAAKYKKGNVTEGTLQLKVNNYTFHSTSIKDGSLVIAGDKAYFQGKGVLTYQNNTGKLVTDTRSFGYLIAATDAQALQKGKGHGKKKDSDKLRILIWVTNQEGTQEEIVFDNQSACSSANQDYNAPACDAIGQGSIVIHKQGMKSAKKESALIAGEDTEPAELLVFPNAFSDRATLSFKLTSSCEYKVALYDQRGTMVRQILTGVAEANHQYEHEIRAEGLPNGLYFARLTSGSHALVVKIVVQH